MTNTKTMTMTNTKYGWHPQNIIFSANYGLHSNVISLYVQITILSHMNTGTCVNLKQDEPEYCFWPIFQNIKKMAVLSNSIHTYKKYMFLSVNNFETVQTSITNSISSLSK